MDDESAKGVPVWQPKYHIDKADEWELADRLLAVVDAGSEKDEYPQTATRPYAPYDVIQACLWIIAKTLVRQDGADLSEQEVEATKALLDSHVSVQKELARPLPRIE